MKSKLFKKNLRKIGFTLLELLVVIGIIAVLVSLGSVSYTSAQKKARDSKRKSDLKTIQNALEQYYSVCGYVYPNSLGTSINCTTPPVITIMPEVPTDPKSTTPYPITIYPTLYQLCTNSLEADPTPSFCVFNQQ